MASVYLLNQQGFNVRQKHNAQRRFYSALKPLSLFTKELKLFSPWKCDALRNERHPRWAQQIRWCSVSKHPTWAHLKADLRTMRGDIKSKTESARINLISPSNGRTKRATFLFAQVESRGSAISHLPSDFPLILHGKGIWRAHHRKQ